MPSTSTPAAKRFKEFAQKGSGAENTAQLGTDLPTPKRKRKGRGRTSDDKLPAVITANGLEHRYLRGEIEIVPAPAAPKKPTRAPVVSTPRAPQGTTYMVTPEMSLEIQRAWRDRRRERETVLDAETVIARLEEAGMTLLALPNNRCMPAGMGNGWPDVVHAAVEAYGYDPEEMRPAVPSAVAITRMDEAWRWMVFLPLGKSKPGDAEPWSVHGGAFLRRIVMMRALVSPVTGRHRWSWRKMAIALHTDHKSIQRWHAKAIDTIVAGMNNI